MRGPEARRDRLDMTFYPACLVSAALKPSLICVPQGLDLGQLRLVPRLPLPDVTKLPGGKADSDRFMENSRNTWLQHAAKKRRAFVCGCSRQTTTADQQG